jgi:hypothetical protein
MSRSSTRCSEGVSDTPHQVVCVEAGKRGAVHRNDARVAVAVGCHVERFAGERAVLNLFDLEPWQCRDRVARMSVRVLGEVETPGAEDAKEIDFVLMTARLNFRTDQGRDLLH